MTNILSKTILLGKTKITKDKNPKMEHFPKTKKLRLTSGFSLGNTVGWGGGSIKHNENDWKFQSYKGTKLGYDMLCESVNYDQKKNRETY